MMITLNGNKCEKLDDYYNPMADNYVVPYNEVTDDIFIEMICKVFEKPYDNGEGYVLMRWDDDEKANIVVTSWVE